jgi:hypothetical protein
MSLSWPRRHVSTSRYLEMNLLIHTVGLLPSVHCSVVSITDSFVKLHEIKRFSFVYTFLTNILCSPTLRITCSQVPRPERKLIFLLPLLWKDDLRMISRDGTTWYNFEMSRFRVTCHVLQDPIYFSNRVRPVITWTRNGLNPVLFLRNTSKSLTQMRGQLHHWGPVSRLRRLVDGFPPRWPEFDPRSGHVGFVVDEVALGQVFSEYFCFPCQFSFHQLLHTHLSSEAGTIGKLVADVPSRLSFSPSQDTKNTMSVSSSPLLPSNDPFSHQFDYEWSVVDIQKWDILMWGFRIFKVSGLTLRTYPDIDLHFFLQARSVWHNMRTLIRFGPQLISSPYSPSLRQMRGRCERSH